MLSIRVVKDIIDNSQGRCFSAMLLSICFLYPYTGYKSLSCKCSCNWSNTALSVTLEQIGLLNCLSQGGQATVFDLAAFRLSMIAPVKKSVNHSRTVASMRGKG